MTCPVLTRLSASIDVPRCCQSQVTVTPFISIRVPLFSLSAALCADSQPQLLSLSSSCRPGCFSETVSRLAMRETHASVQKSARIKVTMTTREHQTASPCNDFYHSAAVLQQLQVWVCVGGANGLARRLWTLITQGLCCSCVSISNTSRASTMQPLIKQLFMIEGF